jgi:hypothetical protein
MRHVYASDQSLFRVGLERGNEEHEDDRAGITELLTAVDALTKGWLHPLGVGFQLVHCDPKEYFEEIGRPPAPHHFLRESNVPDAVFVRAAFSNSVVEELPSVDIDAVRRAIIQGLEQPAPPGVVTTLSELQWTAVRALAPTTDPIALEVVGMPVSTVSRIVDDLPWFYGPTGGTAGPPARLRAVNDHFVTRIQLELFWDLWIGQADGRALLEAGVSRVLARAGWERTTQRQIGDQ